MKWVWIFFILSVSVFRVQAAPAKRELFINACGITRGAFVVKLATEYNKRYHVTVYLNKKGGVNQAIDAVYRKKANVGFGCRALLNLPKDKALKSAQVAWGILAFIVHPKNPVDHITLEQAKAILQGTITNWKALGGADAPIHLYLRKPGVISGVGYSLRKIIFKNLRVKLRPTKYALPSSGYIREGVAKDPYAFGVGDGASATAFGKVKLLKVNGVKPTKAAMASKQYKATRPYYIYLPKKLTPEAKKFVAFTLSKEGQAIIRESFAASLDEGKRLLRLLNESADLEKVKIDNAVSIDAVTKRYAGQSLSVYACGITRVAFARDVIQKFSRKYHVNIKSNPSGGVPFVLKKLHKQEAQIGFVCRVPFKNSQEKDLWHIQVAWGALAFIVHPKNPMTDLTTRQIKAIISGRITNWKEVGGADAPIHLILRAGDSSGVGSTLRSILFGDKHYLLKRAHKLTKNSGEVRQAVMQDPLAIGVDDVTSSQRIEGVKIVNIDGVTPTKRAIIEGDYKFRRPFYACMTQKPSNLTKLFINYTLSQTGQKIISLSGTANLAEGKDIDSQNNFVIQKLKFRMQSR